MNLIDTDVLIDCLRGTPSATAWLKQLARQSFVVPGVVAMELVMGCADGRDLHKVQKFLNAFQIVWPEASDFALAYQLLVNHRLSSGLNIPDCLIAATAIQRGARLYTFNLRHFNLIPGLDVQAPYKRP